MPAWSGFFYALMLIASHWIVGFSFGTQVAK